MEQITYKKTYKEYKNELDTELTKAAESFVRIGYLLKVARDTEILAESGYKSVVEFARAEYNIDKTQVSRFIRINDRFSENGYSCELKAEYKGFGYAKLTLMLQLPSAVNECLTQELSKADIQAIKDEVDAEKETTDIEIILEQPDHHEEESEIESIIKEIGKTETELFKKIHETIEVGEKKAVIEAMAPAGEKIYSVRIKGAGRFLVNLKDDEEAVSLVKIRTNEKINTTWTEIAEIWKKIIDVDKSTPKNYYDIYGIEFPGVAQPKKEKRKESKVAKAKVAPVQPKKEYIPPEIEEIEEANQIPGQMNVNDYPEIAPESGQVVDNVQTEIKENVEMIKCEEESADEIPNVEEIAEIVEEGISENAEKIECEDTCNDVEEVDRKAIENVQELVRAIAAKDYEAANYIIDTLKKQIETLMNVEKTE